MKATHSNSAALNWIRAKVVELFGADLRSLAAFRIVLALLLLGDIASRVTDLSAHYTDDGVLPREAYLEEEIMSSGTFSLSMASGEAFFQALLFGVLALAALGLLVGYRTRLMSVVAWVVLISIQFRNPLLSGAGEPFLRMLLFWSMFLPLGAIWSVDRARKAASLRPAAYVLSLGTVGLFLQIAFMYWFTALQKSGEEWRVDGTALYYALSYDQVATSLGAYLLNFPALLKVMTFATILLEAFGPLLLFFPFFTGLVRTGAVLAFMSLHFGIWLTMDIGIFPYISAFCMVCFLPSWFWDRLVAGLSDALPERLTGFALRLRDTAADLARAHYSSLRARLSPTVGLSAGGSDPAAPPDVEEGKDRPAARAKAGAQNTVAGPTMLRSSLVTNLLASFFLVNVFLWNLTTVSAFTMPERLEPVGNFFGLVQSWSMFAPSPARGDGWFVIPGKLAGGQQVDLMPVTRDDFELHPVSWEKPRYISATDKNEHWRKYLQSLIEDERTDERLYFGRYICREWNARHSGSERLETFQITYMLEETQPNYRPVTPEKVVLRNHRCLSSYS